MLRNSLKKIKTLLLIIGFEANNHLLNNEQGTFMAVQLLAYAQAISPEYEEDLTLDVLNRNDQPSVIQKIEQETQ